MMPRLVRVAFAVLIIGLAGACSEPSNADETSRNNDGNVVEGGELGAFRIGVGDCFNTGGTIEIESVDAVPCTQPHEKEAYASFSLLGDNYPGDLIVEERAADGCFDRFSSFVGIEYSYSIYDFGIITPTRDSWEQVDDREVICTISHYDGTRKTGSAHNARE